MSSTTFSHTSNDTVVKPIVKKKKQKKNTTIKSSVSNHYIVSLKNKFKIRIK